MREAEHSAEAEAATPAPSVGTTVAPHAGAILRLQSQIGNRAVAQFLGRPSSTLQVSRSPWTPPLVPWWSGSGGQDDYDTFLAKVAKIAKRRVGPTDEELDELAQLSLQISLSEPTGIRVRRLEQTLLLWRKRVEGMDKIIEVVTGARGRTPSEQADVAQHESQRGRFDDTAGQEIKDGLAADAARYKKGASCLNFLAANGLARLFGGYTDKVEEAKTRYWAGARERAKRTSRHARTLSRLASELRLEGLVGPVHLLRWHRGSYHPRPTVLFERLSAAGDGWYFFLASLGSFHTLIVAVHVAGESRTYFKIQDGGSVRKTAKELNEYVEEYGPIYGATSRIWQAYVKPAGIWYDPTPQATEADAEPTPSG